jgi:hypothetical protein
MGQSDPALIEQASDGLLLLGSMGETLTSHYSFYAVFQTSEEYRLIADGPNWEPAGRQHDCSGHAHHLFRAAMAGARGR